MNQEDKELLEAETDVSAEEATDEAQESGVEASQSEESLPEKFQGKSAAEIARAALEAEKMMHERAVEASSMRRQLQETQERIAQLQAQYSQSRVEEIDPIQEIEKTWDEDPKKATVESFKRIQETLAQREQRAALEARQREGFEFYNTQKSSNPDFVQREADMVELSRKYSHLVNPAYANSKDVMEILYLASKGAKISEYEKAAADRAKKQQETIKDEKRKAVSERSGAQGSSSDDGLMDLDAFARLSPEQMQAELERSARKLGRG